MWLKKSRTRALLAELAGVIAGEATKDSLKGSYRGYGVEAFAHRGYPIQTGGSTEWSGPPPPDVDMFVVTLAGLGGASSWHCQSSSWMGLRPAGFEFQGVDVRREVAESAWTGVIKRLGVPISVAEGDQALQERLTAAGLFDVLAALRWGKHPYLPKVQFTPPGREWVRDWLQSGPFGSARPELAERLRAHGLADIEGVMSQHMAEIERKAPGRLTLWVEAGKDRVPPPERFDELLANGMRIAQINQEANPSRIETA